MSTNEIILKKRSWGGRLKRFPGLFIAQYQIVSKHNNPFISLLNAWRLSKNLLRP